MKKCLLPLLLVAFAGIASAQESDPFSQGMSATTVSSLNLPAAFVKSKPVEKYETRGNEYLFQDWRRGTIVVNRIKAPFDHNQIKIDLMHDMLEFNQGKEGLKVMDGPAFDTLYLLSPEGNNQTFVRAEKLRLPVRIKGVCEVLYDGKFQIVKTYYTKVLPADYNVALMVGRKYDELVVRSELYVIEGANAYELPKKKAELLDLLSRHFPSTREAYKKNKPLLKEESSLLAFIKLNLEPQQ